MLSLRILRSQVTQLRSMVHAKRWFNFPTLAARKKPNFRTIQPPWKKEVALPRDFDRRIRGLTALLEHYFFVYAKLLWHVHFLGAPL